jgi:hypothetical protein
MSTKGPVDLAAELKRLEEELERKKMEEKIQSLKAQLADDDEYVEESEYYEEEIDDEYEEEVYYEEEEYYEGDEYEVEEDVQEEESHEEEESEQPAPAPRPSPAAPAARAAPAPASKPSVLAPFGAPFRATTSVTRPAASPSVNTTSSATPPTELPRQLKKVVNRKVKLTGKPKYINEVGGSTASSAAASKTPTAVPAPAPAPSTVPASQPKAGVRRIFGLGKKPASTESEAAPATAQTTDNAQARAAASKGASPGSQTFKARTYSKDPASASGQETPMELILGPDLFAESRLIRRSVLACTKDRDLTLLYFASKWNRECKEFYPALKDFYCTIALPQNLEIVYVSHDRSLADFKEIFATMPWPAMPTGTSSFKNELAKNLKIIETPALAVLDTRTGYCITTHAMSDVAALERKSFEQAYDLVNTWRSIKPIPFEEVMMDVRLKHGKLERKPLYWQE